MALVERQVYDIEIGKLIIESARIEEAKEIIIFVKAVDNETDYLMRETGEFNISIEEEKEFIRDKEKSYNSIFLTAKVNGKIVGTIGFSGNSLKRYRHKGQFGIAILKDYWNYGIGSKMLSVMLDWADKNEFKKITLEVDDINEKAIKLYQKFGFEIEGKLKNDKYLGNGEYRNSLIMARLKD